MTYRDREPYASMNSETWEHLTNNEPGCEACGEPPGWPCRCPSALRTPGGTEK